DIIPVFFISFTVSLAHYCQLVRYLLGNILRYLLYKSIILQRASGHVQRQIRTVDDALQEKKEFRDHLFDIIGDKHLIIIQFDRSLYGIILCIDLWEIKNFFKVE